MGKDPFKEYLKESEPDNLYKKSIYRLLEEDKWVQDIGWIGKRRGICFSFIASRSRGFDKWLDDFT